MKDIDVFDIFELPRPQYQSPWSGIEKSFIFGNMVDYLTINGQLFKYTWREGQEYPVSIHLVHDGAEQRIFWKGDF